MQIRIIILGGLFLISACHSNKSPDYIITQDIDTSVFNSNNINPILTVGRFSDDSDKDVADGAGNMRKLYEKLFQTNLAMIYFSDIGNTQGKKDSAWAICWYVKEKDTMHIKGSAGFFGGYTVDIKIVNNKYWATFSEYAQDTLFKTELIGERYKSEISVEAESESLLINKRAEFKEGEKIFGKYEGIFKPYYENNIGITCRQMKVKVIFKCSLVNTGS